MKAAYRVLLLLFVRGDRVERCIKLCIGGRKRYGIIISWGDLLHQRHSRQYLVMRVLYFMHLHPVISHHPRNIRKRGMLDGQSRGIIHNEHREKHRG